jgi:hypothetical protein
MESGFSICNNEFQKNALPAGATGERCMARLVKNQQSVSVAAAWMVSSRPENPSRRE